jgi:type IV pilus assembly protein PilE
VFAAEDIREQSGVSMRKTNRVFVAQSRIQQGFTLIELMITVAIIGILASIAYPSYSQYVVKSNRAAAEGFITSVTSKQQQYLLDARVYATDMATLGYTSANIPTEVSKNYSVTLTADNTAPPTYTVTATPIPGGSQASNDTKCGALTLDQAGTKGKSGTGSVADCW